MGYQAINYKNIPVQSEIISGIIGLDVDSISCFRDLDGFVRSDQGVATLLLRVVNSPIYSRGRKIATIPMAISVLGFNVVRSLAMLAFSRSLFSQTQIKTFRIHLWQHSLLTAIAGQSICQAMGHARDKDEAFIAGLMHDVGKVLMFTHDQSRYLTVLQQVLEQGRDPIDVERELFGFDHCAVGREAVAQWKLPEHFVDYMGENLATPPAPLGNPVQRCLAAANCIIEGIGIGARPANDGEMRKAALLTFGLDESLSTHCVEETFIEALINHETYQLCANL